MVSMLAWGLTEHRVTERPERRRIQLSVRAGPTTGPFSSLGSLDPPELPEQIRESQALHDRPSVRTNLPELARTPLP